MRILEQRVVAAVRDGKVGVAVVPLGLAGLAAEEAGAAVVDGVSEPERVFDIMNLRCPDGTLFAVAFLPGGVFLETPDES